MRVAAASVGLLLLTTSAYAQMPCAQQIPAYDPYKPSHLAIMREYGGTVLAQAPLTTLLNLDPYVPSQGELLRQLGRGIPVWMTNPWYGGGGPAPGVPDCTSPPEPATGRVSMAPLTRFADVMRMVEDLPAGAVAPPAAGGAPRDSRISVSIQYAGRRWVNTGAAVPLRNEDFVLSGKSEGFPVFRRSGEKDDVIFLPTTRGMVAPFRPAP